jgi:uncharacterized protein (DUF1684 family)
MLEMQKINTMKKYLLLIILISSQRSLFAQGTNSYVKSINEWHKKRENDLKQPNGWLNLEGLFWLNKGVNTFGKAEGNDSRYQDNDFPAYLGDFNYEGDSVVWVNKNNNTVKINNLETKGTTPVVVFNKEGKAKVMDWSHFRWSVIKREEKVGIRLRNLEAAALKEFKSIDHFSVDSNWRLKAVLVQPVQDLLMITNVLGQTTAQKSAGRLLFTIDKKEYSLDVIDEGGPNLFIVFGDETAGKTTYGAGRFIDIPKPDGSGNTEIDFNKAYNPPCAFTAFATCPLPPPQNRLKVSITAGEKNYGHH